MHSSQQYGLACLPDIATNQCQGEEYAMAKRKGAISVFKYYF